MPAREYDFYAILELAPAASGAEIKAAHARLIRHWHPDINPSPLATARAALINRARDVLLDPEERAAFDRSRGGAVRTRRPAAPEPASRPTPRPARAGSGITTEELDRRWQDAPGDKLGFTDQTFVPGHWYADRQGAVFTVTALQQDRVTIHYRDGMPKTFLADKLWNQWLAYLYDRGQERGTGSPPGGRSTRRPASSPGRTRR